MKKLAAQLPEHKAVLSMYGVGETLSSRVIAEIGDITRFHNKRALTAFAGLDAPPYQSGQLDMKRRKISKRGSPYLRHTLFLIMSVLMINQPEDDSIYHFMCKKRAEGKHYYVYMTAGSNKFLRQYYGKITKFLDEKNQEMMLPS